MIASDLLHARKSEREEGLAALLHTAATLFPTLSFSEKETAKKKLSAEEVVWIEGTVTVSF